MTLSIQTIVLLCASAGFLIVWLVFPARRAKDRYPADGPTSASASSSTAREDGPGWERAQEEPSTGKSTDLADRPRWCDVLLLDPDATPAAIRKAYTRSMKGIHPDVAGADENTSRQCALVQDAYRQAMQDRGAQA